MEQLLKRELAGETEVLGQNLRYTLPTYLMVCSYQAQINFLTTQEEM
jgi:hypothetical protein